MAKIDKSQYTKEQWRAIKEQRRREKALNQLAKLDQDAGRLEESYSDNPLIKDKNYILCLKHGTKYSSDYVNKLYNGVKRHCTLDFEMVCLTDDPRGIHQDIKILRLPGGIAGWWCKPYMFSKDLPLKGVVLYMDLDVVIADNIDKLFTWQPDHWCTLRDFTRAMQPNWKKFSISEMRDIRLPQHSTGSWLIMHIILDKSCILGKCYKTKTGNHFPSPKEVRKNLIKENLRNPNAMHILQTITHEFQPYYFFRSYPPTYSQH
mgnify:CR=1 FL=1